MAQHVLSLPADPAAVPDARHWVRKRLAEEGSAWDPDTVELLVSELVTNAVLHSRTDIRLVLQVAPALVRAEVHDGLPLLPPPRTGGTLPDEWWESGRGLHVVRELASRWGAYRLVSRDGPAKVVWAELVRPEPRSSRPVGQPQPETASEGARPAGAAPRPSTRGERDSR